VARRRVGRVSRALRIRQRARYKIGSPPPLLARVASNCPDARLPMAANSPLTGLRTHPCGPEAPPNQSVQFNLKMQLRLRGAEEVAAAITTIENTMTATPERRRGRRQSQIKNPSSDPRADNSETVLTRTATRCRADQGGGAAECRMTATAAAAQSRATRRHSPSAPPIGGLLPEYGERRATSQPLMERHPQCLRATTGIA
jgi:hypothetical protein